MLKINKKLIPASLTKLWENPSPSSNFDPQTISFNAINYDYFITIYKNTATSTIYNSKMALKNTRFSLDGINSGKLFARNTDINGITNTGVTFQNGIYVNTFGVETSTNDTGIPYQIYGGKF